MVVNALERYWGVLALLLWGAAVFGLGWMRFDPYGLDEGAARALLINWSVGGDVTNPIVIFGVPDFRALLFIPLGLYWSGNLLAAKIFTLLITFLTVTLLFRWARERFGTEVALAASAMLLIAPASIVQMDSLGVAPYLLLAFTAGALADQRYRQVQHAMGGWFFVQLLVIAMAVSLHPAGLAYPLALAWGWYKNPTDKRHQRHMWIGLTLTTAFILLLRRGWPNTTWFTNPLAALGGFPPAGTAENPSVVVGAVFGAVLVLVLWKMRHKLLEDLFGTILLGAVLVGMVAADGVWTWVCVVVVLYYGGHWLIAAGQGGTREGVMGRYGLPIAIMTLVGTAFMLGDKAHARYIASGELTNEDALIRLLSKEAADPSRPFFAASQWPARTMIACKRDAVPLPPAKANGEEFMKSIAGVTHLMFDPRAPSNHALVQTLSMLVSETETIAVHTQGAIVRVRRPQITRMNSPKVRTPLPSAPTAPTPAAAPAR